MEIRKVQLSETFDWIIKSFKLTGRHWGKFALLSLLTFIAVIALVLPFSLAIGAFANRLVDTATLSINWPAFAAMYLIMMIVFIALFPPLLAGWMLVCKTLAEGGSAGIASLFGPYNNGRLWRKLIQFFLLALAVFIVIDGVYIGVCLMLGLGGEFEKFAALQFQKTVPVQLSSGFWIAYAGIVLLGFGLQCAMMLGLSEATYTASSAFDSLKKGFQGFIKNFFAFIVLLLALLATGIVAFLCIALLVGAGALLASLIDNLIVTGIGIALLVVFYLALMLLIYPLQFSLFYYCWNGILGSDETNGTRISDSEVSA